MPPKENMVILVFVEGIMEPMEIDKAADLPQGGGNAQFFHQAGFGGGNAFSPTLGCEQQALAHRPPEWYLPRGTLLQQQLPTIIDEEH